MGADDEVFCPGCKNPVALGADVVEPDIDDPCRAVWHLDCHRKATDNGCREAIPCEDGEHRWPGDAYAACVNCGWLYEDLPEDRRSGSGGPWDDEARG